MSRLVIACVLRAKSSIGSCPKGGIVSFPYDKTPVLLLYEITSTTNWDVAFDVSLRYDATSTERRALRSMERTAVAADVPSAGMAEASAETMARDRMKFIVIKLCALSVCLPDASLLGHGTSEEKEEHLF